MSFCLLSEVPSCTDPFWLLALPQPTLTPVSASVCSRMGRGIPASLGLAPSSLSDMASSLTFQHTSLLIVLRKEQAKQSSSSALSHWKAYESPLHQERHSQSVAHSWPPEASLRSRITSECVLPHLGLQLAWSNSHWSQR